MMCPKCEIVDMRVERRVGNQLYLKCRKCGEEAQISVEEEDEE